MKYTCSFIRMALVIAAFSLLAGSAHAQNPLYHILLRFNPPVSPFLSDWQSRASTATVDVISSDTKSRLCKILAEFYINGVQVAFTKIDKITPRTIPVGSSSYNGEALVPLSAVHFDNSVDQSSQRAGRIPDGQLCVRMNLNDAQTGALLATDYQCTLILSYSPPQLILPLDNSELCKLGNNNVINKRNGEPMPVFQWTPIVPAPQSQVIYRFAIFEVLPGQSPIAAFRGARPVFTRDLQNLTNLLWPTEFFLPEKGKSYTWSVRALDANGNPFILTNDGWATPFMFSVPPNCDQSANSGEALQGLLIIPQILDFGSVRVGSTSDPKQITLINSGTGSLSLHPMSIIPPGSYAGFSLESQPALLDLEPGVSTSFNIIFKPTKVGMGDGSVRIANDVGSALVLLKGQGIDATSPTIRVLSPAGGENLTPGSQFIIKFIASDNDALSNYVVSYSVDGGVTFSGNIFASVTAGNPSTVLWNIPDNLQTSQGIIKIAANDKSGNLISGFSGLFSVGATSGQNGNPGGDQNNLNGSNPSGLNGNGRKSGNTNLADIFIQEANYLELENKMGGWVHSVEGGHATSDVIREKKPDPVVKKEISSVSAEGISISCGAGMSKQFYDWLQGTFDRKYTRKDGAIIAADYDHKEVSRLDFYQALISEIGFPALDASSKDACKMTIKFQPESVKLQKPDSTTNLHNTLGIPKQKLWLPANFRLKIDGLEEACLKVNKIEAITIKQKNIDNPTGDIRDYEKQPAKLEMPNLVFTLPESASSGFKKWHDDVVINGNASQKNGTLDYLADDGTLLFTLTFQNLGIIKVTPEKNSGRDNIKRVKIELYIEEIKFDYKNTGF